MPNPDPIDIHEDTVSSPWTDAVADGDARVIFNDPAVRLVAQVAEQEITPGLALELAVLRVLLVRLLIELCDLTVLVPLVARLMAVTLQAMRLQRTMGTQGSEALIDAVGTILAELDNARRS